MIKADYIVKASQQESVYPIYRSEENLHALMLALMCCGEEYFYLKEFENAKKLPNMQKSLNICRPAFKYSEICPSAI